MKRDFLKLLTIMVTITVAIALLLIIQNNPPGSLNESHTSKTTSINSDSEQSVDNSQDVSDEKSIPEPKDAVVRFLACPDNIIHPSVYYDAIKTAAEKKGVIPQFAPLGTAEYDFTPIYQNVKDDIAAADVAYINVETLIGGNKNGINGYPNFNTPEANGHTLLDLGFDVFNLAHNHMLDSYNDKFLINCNEFFEKKGGTTIGFYKDTNDTNNIKVVESNGIKIAFLAYTYSTNGIVLPASSKIYIPYFSEELIKKQVAAAKKVSDIIIVSAHWGDEDNYTPNSYQRKYAQLFADLDVDVVIGMHPHVIQPMKWVDKASGEKMLLTYSLGNFVSGMYNAFNMLGGTLGFDIVKDGKTGIVSVEKVVIKPIVTHYTKPKSTGLPLDTGYRNFVIHYLEDYTAEMAANHHMNIYELNRRSTLEGGKFSIENLVKTVKKYIPEEFLPEYYQN